MKALADGGKVLLFSPTNDSKHSVGGAFPTDFWCWPMFAKGSIARGLEPAPGTQGFLCDPRHPALAEFPTEFHSNWQWWRIVKNARPIILDETPADYRPIVHVIDNFARNHKLGVVFEGRAGRGQLLVCGLDLLGMTKDPAARQLLASLHAYAGSAAFKPTQELSDELLEGLFLPKFTNKLQALGATIRADSQAGGEFAAANAMDGDADTMWHTPWEESAPEFPHELVVELPKPVRVAGLTCLPRQDGNHNGWIKDYAVHVSTDGQSWGPAVAQGTFKNDGSLHTIKLAKPVETRFLKLVAVSSFDPAKPYASLAELSVITGE
jgi:hypothetical protein